MEIKLIVLVYLVFAAVGAAQRRRYLYYQQQWGLGSKRNLLLENVLHYGKWLSLAVFFNAIMVGLTTGWITGTWMPLFGRVLILPGVFYCISYTIGDIFWKGYWEEKAAKKYRPSTPLTESSAKVA